MKQSETGLWERVFNLLDDDRVFIGVAAFLLSGACVSLAALGWVIYQVFQFLGVV